MGMIPFLGIIPELLKKGWVYVKKCGILLLALIMLFSFIGCGGQKSSNPDDFPTFEYTHYASGGTEETYKAVILFEQSCSTFTSYQVSFLSCTCRDPMVNYYSVCYVELLNTKSSADLAAIRTITFGNNQGLWGDSNPNYYIPEYTEEYYDEHLVQPLVGATKAEFDSWQGYGTQLDRIDADAVSGATVSSSNITSMLKGLFEYHAEHYYK